MKTLHKMISVAAAAGLAGIMAMPAGANEIRRNNPDTIHAPFGVYTHSVAVPATSELIFISGQTGLDKEGKTVPGGIREQTRQALANLNAVLEAEGLTPRDIIGMTVYLTDLESLPASSEERRAFLDSDHYPAATLLIVASLAEPDLLIEIDAIAARTAAKQD